MKLLLYAMLIFPIFQTASAESEVTTLAACQEMLNGSKSKVTGTFRFAQDLQLLADDEKHNVLGIKLPLRAKVKANRDVEFSFNHSSFLMKSPGGIKIDVGPAVVTVPWISYDKETGEFDLGTKLLGAEYEAVNDTIKEGLKERLGAKLGAGMDRFYELMHSTTDPEAVKDGVVEILQSFANPEVSGGIPDYAGYTELHIEPAENCKAQIGPMYGMIQKDQTFRTRLSFRGTNGNFETTGIRIKSDGECFPISAFENANFGGCVRGISFSEGEGFQLDATNDVDTGAATLSLLIHVIRSANGGLPRNASCDCDGIGAQEHIDSVALGKIKDYIRANYDYLRQYGFSERLLQSVLNDNSSAINHLVFYDWHPLPEFEQPKEEKPTGINRPDFCISC